MHNVVDDYLRDAKDKIEGKTASMDEIEKAKAVLQVSTVELDVSDFARMLIEDEDVEKLVKALNDIVKGIKEVFAYVNKITVAFD